MDGIVFLPFSIYALLWAVFLIVLLILSALVSGSETAFFSLSPTHLSALDTSGTRRSHTVLRLLDQSEKLLSSILIANNLVNIAAVLVANNLIDATLYFAGMPTLEFIFKTVLLTFFLLLFGEMLPKIAATFNPLIFARRMSLSIEVLCKVLSPISWFLVKMGGTITDRMTTQGTNVSIDQLQDAIDITETDSDEDKRMFRGIVRFSSIEVVEICIPRIDVVALDSHERFSIVMQTVVDSGFSRIPVYQEDFDHVIGILYIKDLLPYIDQSDDFKWQELLRKPYFVPEHKKIDDLLAEFQSRKIHMSVVVDEYGGTLGIVTLEDILEEIVGEINDESDVKADFYQQIDPITYIFEGRTHLGDFMRVLNLSQSTLDDDKGDADTVAGLMLEVRGDFFKVGQSVTVQEMKFVAREVEGHRITKVMVKLPQPPVED